MLTVKRVSELKPLLRGVTDYIADGVTEEGAHCQIGYDDLSFSEDPRIHPAYVFVESQELANGVTISNGTYSLEYNNTYRVPSIYGENIFYDKKNRLVSHEELMKLISNSPNFSEIDSDITEILQNKRLILDIVEQFALTRVFVDEDGKEILRGLI